MQVSKGGNLARGAKVFGEFFFFFLVGSLGRVEGALCRGVYI
jgi:hypothetical protein